MTIVSESLQDSERKGYLSGMARVAELVIIERYRQEYVTGTTSRCRNMEIKQNQELYDKNTIEDMNGIININPVYH